jgi:streptogramin lyase
MRMTELFAVRRARRVMVVLVGAIALPSVLGGFAGVVSGVVHAPFTAVRGDHDDDSHRKGSVWVVNRDLGELPIFDAESGTVMRTLHVGAGAHDICISGRAGKAYITAETNNAVTTVDTKRW